MANPQLTPEPFDRALVAPTVPSDFGHQPPQSFGVHCVVAEPDPCWLRDGCFLLAHGSICGEKCFARITSY